MPFPETIRAELLVQCRRSCCICHRFRGVNIEVHHIQPEAQGGSNEPDNGIPLCFDCHADVEHYNNTHPRGTKYSEKELRKYKANWLSRVANTGTSVSTEVHKAIDKRIAEEIHGYMTSGGSYIFLKEDSLWTSFPDSKSSPILKLNYLFGYPDMEFLDADLESSRAKFAHALNKAVEKIVILTGPSHLSGWFTVGSEFELLASPNFEKIKADIDAADLICSEAADCYLDLYKLVRQKTGLDLRF